MINTPIYRGKLQSDLDCAGFDLLNFSGGGGGGGGTSLPPSWVNVKDAPYNATGNGVADDTAAIQAAINDTWNAGGGTVYLPPGKYLCNGTLDTNSHSILRIPFITYTAAGGTNTPSVELRGAFPVSWWLSGLDSATYQETRIVTTRTDGVAANGDALFACGPFIAGSFPADMFTNMNWSRLTIRNIRFVLPANPTFYGLRLDCLSMATVEDCDVATTNVTVQPTHGTVGIRMPASYNYGINFLYRTMVSGFGTGVKTGEHFRSNGCYISRNVTGIEFEGAIHPSFVEGIIIDGSQTCISITATHQIMMNVGIEHLDATYPWMQTTNDVVDFNSDGSGQIFYDIFNDVGGTHAADIIIYNAINLRFTSLSNPNTRPLAHGYFVDGALPPTGTVGTPTAPFTVRLPKSSAPGGMGVTITPSDGGGGGVFTPSAIVLTGAFPGSATFTYTAGSTGAKTISYLNNAGWPNPASYGLTIS